MKRLWVTLARAVTLVALMGPPRDAAAVVGDACQTDTDCGEEAETCLTASSEAFFGGGPPGGLCAVDCSVGGESICEQLGRETTCVVTGDAAPDGGVAPAWCLPSCVVETAETGKCGRADLACFRTQEGAVAGSCQPVCQPESACGSGICEPGAGLCIDELPAGDRAPVGTHCDPASSAGQCDGMCFELAAGFAACTAFCTLGTGACARTTSGSTSYCLLPADPALARGDVGYCLKVCDCNADCSHPDAICTDLGPAGFEETGHHGACLPRGMASGAEGLTCEEEPPPEPEPEDQAKGCGCRLGERTGTSRSSIAASLALLGIAYRRRRVR